MTSRFFKFNQARKLQNAALSTNELTNVGSYNLLERSLKIKRVRNCYKVHDKMKC